LLIIVSSSLSFVRALLNKCGIAEYLLSGRHFRLSINVASCSKTSSKSATSLLTAWMRPGRVLQSDRSEAIDLHICDAKVTMAIAVAVRDAGSILTNFLYTTLVQVTDVHF
jgi:hypothetical protein